MLPRGFGVAWFHGCQPGCVAMPIPLNLLAGLLRRGWLVLKRGVYRDEVVKLKRENNLLLERVYHVGQANHFLTDLAVQMELRDQERLRREFPSS